MKARFNILKFFKTESVSVMHKTRSEINWYRLARRGLSLILILCTFYMAAPGIKEAVEFIQSTGDTLSAVYFFLNMVLIFWLIVSSILIIIKKVRVNGFEMITQFLFILPFVILAYVSYPTGYSILVFSTFLIVVILRKIE